MKNRLYWHQVVSHIHFFGRETIMRKDTICIGLLDKDTKVQEINTVDAFKIVANIFASCTGGATITEGCGVYTHDDGEIVIEKSLVCFVYGGNDKSIELACEQIKIALNQESVAIETTESNSRFF